MGSSFSLVLFGPDRPGLESAAAAAFAEAHRLEVGIDGQAERVSRVLL